MKIPSPREVVYTRIDSIRRKCGEVLRGKDVHDIEGMKRTGLSLSAISELTGYDRKTIRKYLLRPELVPRYKERAAQPCKLDRYKAYLEERLKAGVWNAQVSLREVRERGYQGGYTIRLAAATAASW